MTVVKSSIVSKPKLPKKNLKKGKSDFVDVFSNSQLTCGGISKEPKNEENSSDSFDPLSEEEESQAPK